MIDRHSRAALMAMGVTAAQIDGAIALEQAEQARERARVRQQRKRDRKRSAPDPVVQPTPQVPYQKPRAVGTCAVSADWRPDMTGLMMADAEGLSGAHLDEELQHFRDYYLSEGREKADWNAAWRCWLRSPIRKHWKAKGNSENERDRSAREWRDARDQLRRAANGQA